MPGLNQRFQLGFMFGSSQHQNPVSAGVVTGLNLSLILDAANGEDRNRQATTPTLQGLQATGSQ